MNKNRAESREGYLCKIHKRIVHLWFLGLFHKVRETDRERERSIHWINKNVPSFWFIWSHRLTWCLLHQVHSFCLICSIKLLSSEKDVCIWLWFRGLGSFSLFGSFIVLVCCFPENFHGFLRDWMSFEEVSN